MHNKHFLREAAKVGVGLLIADLASVIWFGSAGFFPLTLLGITWYATAIWPIAILDLSLIILLAHYGWSMRLPIKSPSERTLLIFVGLIFLVVALVHLARIAFGWTLVLGEADVPLWASWLGFLIPGYLSYSSFHFALRK